MTEAEWLGCDDPQVMLTYLQEKGLLSERKARLFAVSCCRRIWHLLTDERSRKVVEVSENYADGLASVEELCNAIDDAEFAWDAAERLGPLAHTAAEAAMTVGKDWSSVAPQMAVWIITRDNARVTWRPARYAEERVVQCHLLRDIFGNPFRPIAINPNWLGWNDGTVRRLASVIYNEQSLPDGHLDVTQMGVLGDALEDAGCANADILAHCRQPGAHVRGCWAVDLLLGKS
jgi:hypothetical protein